MMGVALTSGRRWSVTRSW